MSAKEILQNVRESLEIVGTSKSVFGEPIHADGKIVVPVAKIAFGFGAGFGSGSARHNSDPGGQGEGGGGGGGGTALPVGALEITPTETRFVRFNNPSILIGAFAAGVLLGRLICRRTHKS